MPILNFKIGYFDMNFDVLILFYYSVDLYGILDKNLSIYCINIPFDLPLE